VCVCVCYSAVRLHENSFPHFSLRLKIHLLLVFKENICIILPNSEAFMQTIAE